MTVGKRILCFIIAALLLCSAIVFSFLYFNGLSGLHANIQHSDGQIKVACVGDSITYGHGVKNWQNRNYPVMLGKALGDEYCVGNFGVSGCTVQASGDHPYTETESYSESLAFNADTVILMMGTNDSKQQNWKNADEFKKEYSALIDRYLQAENKPRILLCTLSAAFYTDGKTSGPVSFGIRIEQINEANEVIRQTAADRGLELIDINELTSQHPEWFVNDGVHPNADGAAAIADKISEFILK